MDSQLLKMCDTVTPMNAFSFRFNGANHVTVVNHGRVRRGRGARVICGARIPADANRTTSAAPISCDTCDRSFTAFVDVMDTDFGFANYDDGTGRFA